MDKIKKICDCEIILNFSVDNKEDFFKKISKELEIKRIIKSSNKFYEALKEREEILNTGIGDGFAIPHGKSNTVIKTIVVYIRLNNEICWGSFDNKNVKNIFLFAVNPKDNGEMYIDSLANLSRKLVHKDFTNKINLANNENEIIEILGGN